MELLISKLMPIFVYPLGASLLLSIMGLLLFRKARRLSSALLITAVAYLWVCSTPAFATWIVLSLEDRYPPVPIEQVVPADVIVLLGGGLFESRRPVASTDQNQAADRLWHAVRLYRAGKAPLILVTGGVTESGLEAEAERLAPMLVEMGVPPAAIWIENRARNTRENALYSADILRRLDAGRVLLVTSAAHMPRAVYLFNQAGVEVVPAATDYRAPVDGNWGQFVWLPQAWALEQTTEAIKEYLGGWYYLVMG